MRPTRLGAVAAFALAAALAALGVPADGWAGSLRNAALSNAALPNLAYAQAQVDRYRALPRWQAPGAPLDASKAKGKRIFVVPVFSALPYQQLLDAGLKAAAAAVGVTVLEQTNQGQPAQWARGVEQAIAEDVDLIALIGAPDPALLRPQLEKARRAGIPVVVGNQVGEGAAGRAAQRLAADAAIAYRRGRANTLVITANDVTASAGLVAAIRSEYGQVCGPGCTITVINVPLARWSTRLPGAVQAALMADPAINFVHPVFDGMTAFAIAGIKAAGARYRLRLGTVDGSASVLALIASKAEHGLVLFDVGTSLDWQGWADMDVILRVLLGKPVPATQGLPRRLFTAANVRSTGTPPSPLRGYGTSYIAGYRQLWGLAG